MDDATRCAVRATVSRIEDLAGLLAVDAVEDRAEAYNAVVAAAARLVGFPCPALAPRLVPLESIRGNDYNPNRVAPPEMKLLRLSVERDGLTMPIVAAPDGDGWEVVDGFHRLETVRENPKIAASLGGHVPVTVLDRPREERIASTVRHNMARGTHQTMLSANLVRLLKEENWSGERIGRELGMDPEEVLRLKQCIGIAEAYAEREFSEAWEWADSPETEG